MKYLRAMAAASLAFVLLSLLPAGPAARELKQRIIPFPEWAASSGEDAEFSIELVELKVGGTPITLGYPFAAGDDWLKEMTLSVRNISGKGIAVFGVAGGLLGGVDEELALHESYKYGIGWGWGKWFDPDKESPPTTFFMPGEVVELSYANVDALTRKVLAKEGEGAFSKLEFKGPTVQYVDGTTDYYPKMKFHGNPRPEKSK